MFSSITDDGSLNAGHTDNFWHRAIFQINNGRNVTTFPYPIRPIYWPLKYKRNSSKFSKVVQIYHFLEFTY